MRSATWKACSTLWVITTIATPAPPDLLDQLEAAPGLLHAERGERLVEEDQPAAPVHEAAQLDRLALAAREVLDRGADRGDAGADVGERRSVSACIARSRRNRKPSSLRCSSRPMKKLATTSTLGQRREVLVDRLDAQRLGLGRALEGHLAALEQIRPADGSGAPARILIRVDLPAPLSPSRASTSPARMSKQTSSSAVTAP